MTEKEALENLLKSDGWLLITKWADDEWTAQLNLHLRSAANDTNDLMALQKIRQVIAAKEAVQRFIARPSERLQQLTHAGQAHVAEDPYAHLSRRGTL